MVEVNEDEDFCRATTDGFVAFGGSRRGPLWDFDIMDPECTRGLNSDDRYRKALCTSTKTCTILEPVRTSACFCIGQALTPGLVSSVLLLERFPVS